MLTLINGKFVPEKNAKIPIDKNLCLGFGLFETLRTYQGDKFFRAHEHLDRLFDSARKIHLPMKYNKDEIFTMLKKIAQKSPHKDQRIKIIALPERTIITSQKLQLDEKIYSGVNCITDTCKRALPEIKSISYLPSFLSHKKAEEQGCFEAILTDEKGNVSEGSYSNIFWFEKDTLCTQADTILPGITRAAVLEISPFKTKFGILNLKKLPNIKEIFLTSSLRGIVPIVRINKQKVGSELPGDNTKKLMSIFQVEVASRIS